MAEKRAISEPEMAKIQSLINADTLEALRKSRFCGRLSVRWERGEVVSFHLGTHFSFDSRRLRGGDDDDDDFLTFGRL